MGRAFYQEYPEVRELFRLAGDTLKMDMERLCFEGPEDELVLTHNVQPAITLINMACSRVLGLHGVFASAAAGHSLGEYSALETAGVFKEAAVLELVRLRGERMQQAADVHSGAMAAILNLSPDKVREICRVCDIEIANFNSPGQIVVSGVEEKVLQAMDKATEAGAKRCVRLKVSGPWHSRYMSAAQELFQDDLARHPLRSPNIPVLANVDAEYVADGSAAREKLTHQLVSPVLWQQSMERLLREGYQEFIEVGPKKVLRGLMRQIDKRVSVYNVEDPPSLEACLANVQIRNDHRPL